MFSDPWPGSYDGVLFGNIFHDWDWKSCQYLALQAFNALNPGGKICLHEMLLNELKDGPLVLACYSVAMLLHERGKQDTVRTRRFHKNTNPLSFLNRITAQYAQRLDGTAVGRHCNGVFRSQKKQKTTSTNKNKRISNLNQGIRIESSSTQESFFRNKNRKF